MTQLTDFRQKHPQYNDMSDQALADALHSKFYPDVPKDDYYSKIGFAPERSWLDRAHMVAGDIAGGIGGLAESIATANPLGAAQKLTTAVTGPLQERQLYDTIAKARGPEFAAAHRQEIHDQIYGKPLNEQARAVTRAPAPVTPMEKFGSNATQFMTSAALGGGLTGAAGAAGGVVRNAIVGGIGGLGGAVGGEVGGRVGGTPGAIVGSIAGSLATGVPAARGLLPRAPPIPAPNAPLVEAGRQARVPVMTSDVRPPATFIGQSLRRIGEVIPITGTGGPRARQQTARIEAVRTLARDHGAMAGDDMTASAVPDVMASFAARRGARLEQLTGQKNAIIEANSGQAVPVTGAVAQIDQQIARLQGLRSAAFEPVINELADFRQAIVGQDLRNIEALRKQIGLSFKRPELASISDESQKALNAIYAPLREDMGNFIRTNGGMRQAVVWQRTNDVLSGMAQELNNTTLRNVLRTGNLTPENVGNLLFSAKPSDVQRLYAGLDPAGRARAQAALLQRALTKSMSPEGELSPDRFSNNLRAMQDQTGIFFRGADQTRLAGLQRVLQGTRRAGQTAAMPPTGAQNLPYILGAGFQGLFGTVGGIGAAAGSGILARAYESPAMRSLVLRLGQTRPGSPQEQALMAQTSAMLAQMAAEHQRREQQAQR